MTSRWTNLYATRTHGLKGSAIRELLKYTQRPGIISFAGGMPAPELFPLERVRTVADRLLAAAPAGQQALQYGPTEGYRPLREMLARNHARAGLAVQPENVLITSGSQQALELLGKLFINRGDHVAVEAPSYLGALQAFDVFGANYHSLTADDQGLQTADLRLTQVLELRPKFMYLLPNFQNPAGVTLPLERRHVVIALADTYGVPIIEDDPYGQLRYEGEHLPTLLELDQAWRGAVPASGLDQGNVIHLGTFSKTLAPGLRVGWVIAPAEVIGRLVQLKQSADLHTSSLSQQLAFEVAGDGFLEEHIRRLREAYRARRDVMLAALEAEMPLGVTWTRPAGGLFLWVQLPAGLDSRVLLQTALEENVAFVPGDDFFARNARTPATKRFLRLNFSCEAPDRIREGIRRLARAVQAHQSAPTQPVALAL